MLLSLGWTYLTTRISKLERVDLWATRRSYNVHGVQRLRGESKSLDLCVRTLHKCTVLHHQSRDFFKTITSYKNTANSITVMTTRSVITRSIETHVIFVTSHRRRVEYLTESGTNSGWSFGSGRPLRISSRFLSIEFLKSTINTFQYYKAYPNCKK